MKIRQAEEKDYIYVSRLHREGITKGFLSTLGVPFLSRLYEAINLQMNSCILIAEYEGEVCGFVAGAADTHGLYKEIILKKWILFILPLVRYLFNIKMIKKMVETLFYGLKKEKCEVKRNTCTAELLSIAVDKRWRGKHIGRRLVSALEIFFKSKDIIEYKVVTFSRDSQSNDFYKACNFDFTGTFVHHNKMMNVYHKKIL
jgi:N-acetylglutamate synthase-like GNAT family acetyltransferase